MGSTSNNIKRDRQRGREFQWWNFSKDSGKSGCPKKPRKAKKRKSAPQLPGSTPHRPKKGFRPIADVVADAVTL